MGYVQDIRKKIGHDMLMLVGAGVYIHKDGKLLLQKRRDDGTWSDHGGCVEVGENVEDAARRELFEETGLTANSLEFLGVFSGQDMLHTYPNGDRACIVGVYYICEDFSGTLLEQTDETLELRWFDLDDLPTDICGPTAATIDCCVERLRER